MTTLKEAVSAVKPIDSDTEGDGPALKRTLGVFHLTALSIGATLGTGIFVILGEATPKAGPAVIISFILAALTALFSALSYAEMSSNVPVSGSAYSFTYVTMGEGFAWLCGWCLMLEYAVSIAAVAVGWSQYINELLFGLVQERLPEVISAAPDAGGVFNMPAFVVVLIATLILLTGGSESATLNAALVVLKIAVLVLFCVVAFRAFNDGNLTPFLPLGIAGMTSAASQVFFSYIGFDAASTAAQEAKNPQRDMPRAILLSLVIVTALYCLVALAAVGAMHWTDLGGTEASLAAVLDHATGGSMWPSIILSIGAVISIASVVLSVLYGQTRILYAMSVDGLIPKIFSKVNPRTSVPQWNILSIGILVAVVAGLVPLGELADATSIGSLAAFALVNISVIVLRRRGLDHAVPGQPKGFKTPLFPAVPILGVLFCVFLMTQLSLTTWIAFVIWTLIGLLVYLFYGMKHSKLRKENTAHV